MPNSFFDKLSANLTNATRTVQQNLKNSTDASKLMSQITAENKSIQENLNAIGKLYYDICKDEPDEAFRPMVEAIIKSEQRITELQDSIKIIRAREPELVPVPNENNAEMPEPPKTSTMVCTGCGNTYPEGTAFCSVCGQKLVPQYQDTVPSAQTAPEEMPQPEKIINPEVVTETAEPETSQFCPYCGKKILISGLPFCDNCGHAL